MLGTVQANFDDKINFHVFNLSLSNPPPKRTRNAARNRSDQSFKKMKEIDKSHEGSIPMFNAKNRRHIVVNCYNKKHVNNYKPNQPFGEKDFPNRVGRLLNVVQSFVAQVSEQNEINQVQTSHDDSIILNLKLSDVRKERVTTRFLSERAIDHRLVLDQAGTKRSKSM